MNLNLSMLYPSVAKHLAENPDWKQLEEHIKSEVDSLSVIDNINFLDKETAAIEGRARQLAREKLVRILEPFYTEVQQSFDKGAEVKKKTGLE